MSLDLLDILRTSFDSALARRAAGYLSESESTVQKGLDTVIPVALLGILNKIDSGDTSSLMALAKEAMHRTHFLDLREQFSEKGSGVPAGAPALLSGLFGERFGAIANAVSGHTGMKGATTSAIFGSVVPYALARLGRYIQENNIAPGGLAALFAPFRSGITGALPAGLSLAGLLDAKPMSAAVAPPPAKQSNWLLPLLGVLALGALLWMLLRGQPKEPVVAATPTTDTVVQVRTDTVLVAGTPKQITLINGVLLDAKEGGIEDLLLAFLNDPDAKAGSDNWFDFGELNFEFGTANILPESQREVSNIIEILKAYPAVKIKLGGYTDRVGNAAENKKLSQARADAVAAALRDAGLAGQVVGAEGYGSEFAKFPESAPEADRVKDRRVSVSVREK